MIDKKRIIIADDHPVVRDGIKSMLEESEFLVVSEVANGLEAFNDCLRLRPDAVIMDVRMPGMDGLTATKKIREAIPDTSVLVLTSFDGDAQLESAVRAGASGLVLKGSGRREFLRALKTATSGGSAFDSSRMVDLIHKISGENSEVRPELNSRDKKVLQLAAEGLKNVEIASTLNLSVGSVKKILQSIFTELGAKDRTHAVVLALRSGIISNDKNQPIQVDSHSGVGDYPLGHPDAPLKPLSR
jgi:DNA-binding NarL/FixJ family response regulator